MPTVEEGNGHLCDIATVIYRALEKVLRWKTVMQKAVQVRYSSKSNQSVSGQEE